MENPDFCRDFFIMHIILFDDTAHNRLLPFTHTRPVADIRCGIMTMRERWEHFFKQTTATITVPHLQEVYALITGDDNIFVNGSVFANGIMCQEVLQLQAGEKLVKEGALIAFRCREVSFEFHNMGSFTATLKKKQYPHPVYRLNHIWDIFSMNDRAIREDYKTLTEGRSSAAIPAGVTITGNELFIEEGAKVNAGVIINTKEGPVYIGKDAEILEGTMIRGPLAMCDHSVIKMGGKIYGATTLGPGCKVGGEISNVVFFANSNKGHDGYLGNAVIGEWCNLGADTNCSNLKNNYDEVKIWSEHEQKMAATGLTFCGLLMADHSKCGINTMFNTGTVVGVSANIYGGGFPDKFVPSFTWGGAEGMMTYRLDKAVETANRMMGRRNKHLSPAEEKMMEHIFVSTAQQREAFTQQ
jgi:UDP-N-acetylglucosamine diphosphorylase/glucosamine-1-phosphate N-acetyltransferase